MTDPRDPLEAELAALRPLDPSPRLPRRVGERLARRWWGVALGGGVAAAGLAAALLVPRGDLTVHTGRTVVIPLPVPSEPADDLAPTLGAYSHALSRSPEDLDALLDRHALLGSRPGPPGERFLAFPRSPARLQSWIGEP
jgi:hypothetical protein